MELEKKSILCMEHCLGKKMFGFSVPGICESCGKDLKQNELRIPPFRLPSPFRRALESPCSIILKPTRGSFLSDYKNSDDLHIGITSSEGVVFEFDSSGLSIGKLMEWEECLAIDRFTKAFKLESWSQYWDFTLQVVCGQSLWKSELYDEMKHNCYTFVLSFLRALQVPELNGTKDRTTFCSNFIIPKTASAAKYITLYRKLMTENGVGKPELDDTNVEAEDTAIASIIPISTTV